ncbi:MAG: type VI secretion system baseplate subunit TssG [Xylophilus ampelinus]
MERLLAEPHRFEFHQAVRLLSAFLRELPEADRPALRFCNTLSLSFPASELASLDVVPRRAQDDAAAEADASGSTGQTGVGAPGLPFEGSGIERLELTPAFIGLLGAAGALPLDYSERFSRHEASSRDRAARAFLDIFQHRAVTLFHAAWRKHRLPLQFEAQGRASYLPLALGLAGLGEPALRGRVRADRGGVADDTLAFYAGLFQRRAVSAQHLESMLGDYFGVPVRLTQFVGRWFALDPGSQATLGDSPARLGRTAVLGPRVWQRDLRARVSVGPMDRTCHRRFLPGGPAALALGELLTLACGASLEFEVGLRLRAEDIDGIRLHGGPEDAPGPHGARLGWDSYLSSAASPADREEIAYQFHAADA